MQQFLVASRAAEMPPQVRIPQAPEGDRKLPRLAFSVRETAELLGISQKTVLLVDKLHEWRGPENPLFRDLYAKLYHGSRSMFEAGWVRK
jgi:hypothetical protein